MVSRTGGRFGFNPFDPGATGGATTQIPSGSNNPPNADQSKPVKLPSYTVDPAAAHENKSNMKPTARASARLVIDALKESSDLFPPLKAAVTGVSAILQHYDV